MPKVSQDFTWIIIHCEEYVNFGAPKVRLEEISYHKSDSLAVQLTLEFLANHKSKPISNKRWIKSYYFEVENQCNIHQRVVFIAHCCANTHHPNTQFNRGLKLRFQSWSPVFSVFLQCKTVCTGFFRILQNV